jgi:hypothetical protein
MAEMRKQPYVRINLTGYTAPDELVGSKSAQAGSTYFEEGVMIKAMRDGALLVFDEINATPPDCLFAIHSLLDDERKVTLPTGTVVYPHPEFRFFATMNPDYEGTKSVNKALTDRFGIILDIDHLEPDKEIEYLKLHNISEEDANIMVMFATKARKAYTERQTSMFVSTRTLLQWGALVSKSIGLDNAFKVSVLNKLPSDVEMRRGINDIYCSVTKKNPQTKKNEFAIYNQAEVEGWKNEIRRVKDEIKQKENQWTLRQSDLLNKLQTSVKKIQEERTRNAQMAALIPQLKKLVENTPNIPNVDEFEKSLGLDVQDGQPQQEVQAEEVSKDYPF